ncbi:MAG TPA: DUF4157 domain-containing protein [Kofleriaceae bacterium]|nr:DUF4157 domain-containing protein [Kofleriaceae bacterium]
MGKGRLPFGGVAFRTGEDATTEQPKIGHYTLTGQLQRRSIAPLWGLHPAAYETLQRMAGGGSAAAPGSPADPRDAHAIAERGVAGAGAPLPHHDAVQASFGRHDIGGIKSQVGGEAAAASAAVGARGYAVGDRVAFADEPDLHTAAHEAAHVVQQRRGVALKDGIGEAGDVYEQHADAVADAVVAGRSAEGLLDRMAGTGAAATPAAPRGAIQKKTEAERYHATANDSGGGVTAVTAQQWMWSWGPLVMTRLGAWLSGAAFHLTSPFVRWRSSGSADFAASMWAPMTSLSGKGQQYAHLGPMIAPDALDTVINAGRDAAVTDNLSPIDDTPLQARGAFEFREGVIDELGKLLTKRIIESLARTVPRWLASKNQLALAAEGGEKGADRDPTTDEVQPSHPIDRYVIAGLGGNLTVDLKAYRAANPDQNARGDLAALGKSKAVPFEWQHDSGAWNWVRVKQAGANREDVAFTLYGDPSFAYTLSDAAPLYGFSNLDDMIIDLRDVHGDTYWDKAGKARKQPQEGDVPDLGVPEQQAQTSALRDEIALNQAAHIKPSVQANEDGRLAVVERMRGALQVYERLIAESAKFPAGGYPSMLESAKSRLAARSHKINDKATPVAEAVQWDSQSQAQLELLNSALNGVVMANAQFKTFESWPNSRSVTQFLGFQYLEVACLSDQAKAGHDKLAYANEQSKLFPVTLAELLLAEVRKALHTQRGDKTGVVGDATHDVLVDTDEHDRREARLREGLARVREKLLQNPDSAKQDLDALVKELGALQTEVSMVADMEQMDVAWRALYDDLSVVGVLTGTNSDDSEAMDALNTLQGEFRAIYAQYRSGDKEAARKALEAKRPAWGAMLEKIKKLIKHNETLNKWVSFGILIGIAIITAGVGAYVEGAAGAVWGATSWATFAVTTGSEALAFTSMSYLIVEKEPSISGFFLELGKNAVLFGALKGIGNKYTKFLGEEAATTAGKVELLLVQFVALNTLALGEADAKKYLTTSQHLSPDEILEISKQNVLFLVATGLTARLAKPGLESLKLQGEVDGSLVKLRGLKGELEGLAAAVEAEKGINFTGSKDLLAKERELLRAEEETLQQLEKLASDPANARKAGLDTPEMRQKLLELRAEHNSTEAAMKPARVMNNMEGSGGIRWVEKGPKFQEAVDHFRENPKNVVTELVTDAETGAKGVEVKTEDGNTFRLMERLSIEGDVVGRTPEPGRKAPTAEEVAANQRAADEARAAMEAQTAALKALIDATAVPEFKRIQIGGDVGGLFNQASLSRGQGGGQAPGATTMPEMLTVSDKAEVWADRGPVNQTPGELEGPGLHPGDMTTDQHGYIDAKPLANAIMLGKYRVGMARYPGHAEGHAEFKGNHSASEWPSSKLCRVKVNGKYFYADAIDLAVGPGPSKGIDPGLVKGGLEGADYQAMYRDGRVFYGDQSPTRVVKPGGKVVVWGGSGNGAAMAEYFAKTGCDVTWVARESAKAPPPTVKPELEQIAKKLQDPASSAEEKKVLLERQRELKAFGQAMLPRNVEEAFDSPLAKEKIHRQIGDISKIEPIEVEEGGAKAQKVKLTTSTGELIVDQLVVSQGQNPEAPGAAGHFVDGIELEMILDHEGTLVGLQSAHPRGAVRLLGAAFADPKLAPHVVADQRAAFQVKLAEQAAKLPSNSKGVAPSIANAAITIQAANDVLAVQSYKLPGNSTSVTLNPADQAIWPQQVATFLGGEMGVDPARITVDPVGDGKSGAPVFRVRLGNEELGYFKVFDDVGKAQTEVSMIQQLAAKKLRHMEVVGEKGAVGVADGQGGTKGGMMMETADGTSVDGMIKSLPTEPSLRPEAIAKVREAVVKVARGLAEMHKAFADGEPQTLAQKQSEARYTLGKLDAIRAQIGEAHYARLEAALQAQISAYEAAKVPATASHGDANTGNFIVGSDGKLKVIDVSDMQWSIDGSGKVKGTGAADVARFLESLQSKRPGALTPAEVRELTELFNKTYFGEMKGRITEADLAAATTMYRAQLELSIIKNARPDAAAAVDQTYVGALGRLDAVLGIPEGEFVVPLTPPSKTSADDKKQPASAK